MQTHWIWFAQKALNDRVRHALLEQFGTAEAVYDADGYALSRVPEIKQSEAALLMDKDTEEAERILGLCLDKRIGVITLADTAYPGRLREIYNAPPVLYSKGTLPQVDSRPTIAIVGTRKASAYGLLMGKRLGYQVSRGGGIVVSSLGLGVDTASAQGALMAGSPVIGVLGTGIDQVYPSGNRELFADVERFGCLLSEYPPEAPVYKWYFSRRNRILSGLCCGVAVVEAPEDSGALLTAQRAAEQGRDVFAVPGNVDLPGFAGSNRLLHSGASAVGCGWDILSEYRSRFGDVLQDAAAKELPVMEQAPPAEVKIAQTVTVPKEKKRPAKKLKQETIDNPPQGNYIDHCEEWKGLSEPERVLMRAIPAQPRLLDDIIAETGLPAAKVLAMLTLLELRGLICRHSGRRVSRKQRK